MHQVRAFIRRVPAGPVIIALLMVAVLTMVNLYGTNGGAEQAAPSEPVVGIPPQLPAEQHAMPSPAATTDVPLPTVAPPPTATTGASPTTTPPANASGATPKSAPSSAPASGGDSGFAPPTQRPATPQNPGVQPTHSGSLTGDDDEPSDSGRLRVASVVLTSDHGPGSQLRCGRDEVVIAATIMVDGGEGDIVYQWFFENARAWPPDQLHFTGSGPRQQSLQIPWVTNLRFSGTQVRGTVQLRILQPAVYAQTRSITVDVICV